MAEGMKMLGAALAALFAMMQIKNNHVQMTYYFLFVIVALAIGFFFKAVKDKRIKQWGIATGTLAVAAALAVCANLPNLYNTYEYSKQSMRGGHSELTRTDAASEAAKTDGLDRDYITQYSYGRAETFTLLIPDVKGGASMRPVQGQMQAMSLADLDGARKALAKINRVIDARMKDDFARTYEAVNANFQEIFSTLFPGGTAHLSLVDPDDMENTGVEVSAQPRGKRITKMMLMSGGEKSLTALALLFAVYRTRTVPFYVLDEVEAALDDANLSKLIGALDVLRSDTQLLVISHQRRTMEDADVLYGVSMQADGVSRVVSQKLDRETGKVVNA